MCSCWAVRKRTTVVQLRPPRGCHCLPQLLGAVLKSPAGLPREPKGIVEWAQDDGPWTGLHVHEFSEQMIGPGPWDVGAWVYVSTA
jgi:hypothetical protein